MMGLCPRLRIGPVSAALLLAAAAAAGQVTDTVASDDYRLPISMSRELLQDRVRGGVPGASVAVSVAGAIVWAEGFGLADLQKEVAVTTATRFRIGSTSKPVTAAAAGLLVDRGDLDLDAPIQTYVPSFAKKKHDFTIRHLLGNQAGIRHYRGLESFNREHLSVSEGIAIFAADELRFEPGTEFQYSSYGFNLVGAAIESISQSDFATFIATRIFEPLGMKATEGDDPTRPRENLATFYSVGSKGATPTMAVDDYYKMPSGGLISTPSDMVRFGAAHLKAGLLSRETIDLLWTPQRLADGRETGYAMGWRIEDSPTETWPRRARHHGGSSVGGRSMLVVLPDSGVVVSLLVNSQNYGSRDEDTAAIANAFAALVESHRERADLRSGRSPHETR